MSSSGVPSMQSTLRTVKRRPFDADQLHRASGDRVGRTGETQREGAPRMTQMRRHLLDQIAPRLVHPIEQERVAVERQIGEPAA